MRLPGINYNTPTQSLGREDINQPIALANAEIRSTGQVIDAIKGVIDANDTAIDASRFQAAFAELNATIKARKSYTIDELDQLGVKYEDKFGIDKIESVPAYMVSGQVYKSLTKELFDASVASASSKGKAVISKMYGQMYKEGIMPIVTNSINEAQAIRSVESEMAYDDAVASGNADAANIIAETARSTGVWGADKYKSKTNGAPNKIATGKYLNALSINNDAQILKFQLNSALSDPDLNSAGKASMYRAYNSKISKIETNNIKIQKEASNKNSYEKFVRVSTDILDSGQPMNWSDLSQTVISMNKTDGKGLITLNRVMQNKENTTDKQTLSNLSVQIKSLSLPREGTTVTQRRKSAIDNLMRAAGTDPATGIKVGVSKISSEDFIKLWDQVNKSQSFAYDNPEIKRMSDFIWPLLTGGSKDFMTRIFGNGPNTINAVNAEADLLRAAQINGPGFDPDLWWSKNGDKYLTEAIQDNERSLVENKLNRFIVRDFNSPGGINIDKTVQGIRNKIKSKSMTKSSGEEAMRQIYDLQKRKIAKQELMKRKN